MIHELKDRLAAASLSSTTAACEPERDVIDFEDRAAAQTLSSTTAACEPDREVIGNEALVEAF